ncbi:MAG: hypothetical protein HY763_14395 [Planctomycetes bacterium]|nr:hypothetical protein [Planctomycetota bacterium]
MAVCQTTPLAGLAPEPRATGWWGRLIHWAAESRSHRVICLVAGIWLLNAFDLALTLLSHEQGLLHEENPFARYLLGLGPVTVLLYKVGLVLIGSYPLLKFRTARVAELGAMVILMVYATLAVHWSTCYEFYAVALPGRVDLVNADLSVPGSSQ